MKMDDAFSRPSDSNIEGVRPPMVFIQEITKWEYKCVSRSLGEEGLPGEAELNELGSEGWELVCLYHLDQQLYIYFKRVKQYP
jgi:hypothetical protein